MPDVLSAACAFAIVFAVLGLLWREERRQRRQMVADVALRERARL